MPSLDTADTALALSTINESLNTGQRDPRGSGWEQQKGS
jgi:hypothetical protein